MGNVRLFRGCSSRVNLAPLCHKTTHNKKFAEEPPCPTANNNNNLHPADRADHEYHFIIIILSSLVQ